MRTLAALALLALGCSPTASPPTYTRVDAGAYDAPTATALDGLGDALTTVTPDAAPCSALLIRCNGVCIDPDDENCGRCGLACAGGRRCCADGLSSFCSFDINCRR